MADRLAEIQARIAAATETVEQWRDMADRAPADLAYLLARCAALEAGLREYGRHKLACPYSPNQGPVYGPCRCGLGHLLTARMP